MTTPTNSWIKESGFFTLSDLSPVRTWNYELPTLVQEARFTNRVAWRKSVTFWKRLIELVPAFEEVNLDGVAIIGGCVVDILLEDTPKDIDLFFVIDDDAPNKGALLAERVKVFIEDLLTWMKKKNDERSKLKQKGKAKDQEAEAYDVNDITVTRYKNVYTIQSACLPYPVQFTFSPPLNKRFQETDISCTEVAYFRKEVIFSERGRQGIESVMFTVDGKTSSPKYIERVIKYYNKGFDIVLPDLDVAKIPKRNLKFDHTEVLDLPFLLVWVDDVKDNKIFVTNIQPSKNNTDKQADSGSGPLGSYNRAGSVTGVLAHQNIKRIIRGHTDDLVFEGKGELYADAFLTDPLIPPRMVNNTYETVRKKLFVNGALDFNVLEDYFTVRPINEILDESVIKFLRENSAKLAKDKDKKLFGEQFNNFMKEYIQKLIAEQVEVANKLIGEAKGKGSLEEYHTGTKPEKACTPAEWYGQYYKAN